MMISFFRKKNKKNSRKKRMVNEIRYEKKFEKFAKKEKNMKISHKIQVKKGWLYSGAVHKKDAKKDYCERQP